MAYAAGYNLGGQPRGFLSMYRQSLLTSGRAARSRTKTRTTTEVAPQAPSPEVMDLFSKAMERYQPGGQFGRRELALLGRAKKKSLAKGYQSAVSAGLGGTSVPEAMGVKFEEEVGAPTRAGLEDVRSQRLNELLMSKAGYLGGLSGQKTTATTISKQQAPQTQFGGLPIIGGGVGGSTGMSLTPDIQTPYYQRQAKHAATVAEINQPGFGAAQIPEGGRIIGGQYFPPVSSYTRNIPALNL